MRMQAFEKPLSPSLAWRLSNVMPTSVLLTELIPYRNRSVPLAVHQRPYALPFIDNFNV